MKNRKRLKLLLFILFTLVAVTGAVFIVICANSMIFEEVTKLKMLGIILLSLAFIISTLVSGVIFNYYRVSSDEILTNTNKDQNDENDEKIE